MGYGTKGSGLLCPICDTPMRTIDTRTRKGGREVKRRRECTECLHRVTTRERIETEGERKLPNEVYPALVDALDDVLAA